MNCKNPKCDEPKCAGACGDSIIIIRKETIIIKILESINNDKDRINFLLLIKKMIEEKKEI
jgi:hypothetical protein